jgi:molybdenum cofactor cytidylyltransferase
VTEVGAIVLAAGLGARFAASGGEGPKVLASYRGEPMVRRVAAMALASRARPVIVVTGAGAAEVAEAVRGLAVGIAHNPDFQDGLASSLRAGLTALPGSVDGALVLLADMPDVEPTLVDALIEAFESHAGALAVLPVRADRRGNPALLSRALFASASALQGDEGAGRLLRALPKRDVLEVEVESDAIFRDADTKDALEAMAKGRR